MPAAEEEIEMGGSMTHYPHAQPPFPAPPQKKNTGKIVGFSCLGILVFLLLVGGCTALLASGDDTSADTDSGMSEPREKSAPKPKEEAAEEKETEEGPVRVEARAVTFTPSILHDGGDFTSVEVTVVNNGDANVEVNPLYFAIVGTDGVKHNADALGQDENQIDTLTLAPGEKATGTVTAEGSFKPKSVSYTEGLFGGDSVTADVK